MNALTTRTVRAAYIASVLGLALLWPFAAAANPFFFSTGSPDGLIATGSRPPSSGIEIESADDFLLTVPTELTSATFTGLLTGGAPAIGEVVVEIYRIFPQDSDTVRAITVPTRANSPSDVELVGGDSLAGQLSFTTSILDSSFAAANSVLNGIHPSPGQFTGGEGPVTGEEVLFNVTFTTPLDLLPGHYFFIPQVEVTGGEFFWLSAPRPIVPPGTSFPPGITDLQSWIRNADLDPDWLRVGTDITHQGPFNAAFSLAGQTVPAPSTLLLLGSGLAGLGTLGRRRKRG